MVDNLAEKVNKCTVCIHLTLKNCLLYGVAGCPLFRGCFEVLEVNGRTVGTYGIARYIVRYIVGVHC